MPDNLVLDTSAVMAMIDGEREATYARDVVTLARRRGGVLLLPFVVAAEVEYLLIRRYGESSADPYLAQIQAWPAELVESDPEWRHETARVKAAGNISFADAWVASLGILRGSPVLHKDPQFEQVRGLKTIDIRDRA